MENTTKPSAYIGLTQTELEALLNSLEHEQARVSTSESYYNDLAALKDKLVGYYQEEHIVQFCIEVTVNARPDAPTDEIREAAVSELQERGIPVDVINEFYTYVDGEEMD